MTTEAEGVRGLLLPVIIYVIGLLDNKKLGLLVDGLRSVLSVAVVIVNDPTQDCKNKKKDQERNIH